MQPVGVVAGGQQQRAGGVRADTVLGDQVGRELGSDPMKPGDGALELRVQERDSGRELTQGQAGNGGQTIVVGADPEGCAGREQLTAGQVPKAGAQVVGGGDQDCPQLVEGLGTGLVGAALQGLQSSQGLDRAVVGLGVAAASADSTARPAAIASTTSDLP